MIRFFTDYFAKEEPTLTEATPRDAMAIATLHAASFLRGWNEQEFAMLLMDPTIIAHCAINRSEVMGFVISRRASDEAEILSVAVALVRRGKGIARKMLTLHLRQLAASSVRSVFLEVDEDNEPAMKLYRRAGFYAVGRRPSYYTRVNEKPSAALVLRRDL